MPDPAPSIFISHTHADKEIAAAIRDAIQTLFGEAVGIRYSTNKELDGGIKPGEDWFRWIGQQVREARIALILLTPASIQKPWVLWEAGAVAGAALATEGADHRKLRPISYKLKGADIPSPFAREQVTDGLDREDAQRLFDDVVNEFSGGIAQSRLIQIARKLAPVCDAYLQQASEALRTAPLPVTEAAVQEWLERIAALEQEGRFSETDELHDWLNVAFGRGEGAEQRPFDLRIHRRLGELYSRAGRPERAAAEFALARQLAPRDLFILRKLGKACLDQKRMDDAREVLDAMSSLDSRAFVRNAENAALQARWFKDQGNPAEAARVLKDAYANNTMSHYLGDLYAQAQLDLGQVAEARQTYHQVLDLIDRLREQTIWTSATGFTAALADGDEPRQMTFLDEIARRRPSPEAAESIRRGAARVAEAVGADRQAIERLEQALAGRPFR
jgi:tetratricopeptide (TPR) repeat protein